MKRYMKTRRFSGSRTADEQPWEEPHRRLARKAAAEGMVLLKNEDGFLPLSVGESLAVYGTGAVRTVKGGTGSGDVNERHSVSIVEGLEKSGIRITNRRWLSACEDVYEDARKQWRDKILEKAAKTEDTAGGFFSVYSTMPFHLPVGPNIFEDDGMRAEHAIFVLSRIAGEGKDRDAGKGDYLLSDEEENLLSQICARCQNIILVINTGGSVDLSFLEKFSNIRSVIFMAQAGMEGGFALADILLGKINPCGKLTDTWAYRYEDFPGAREYSHLGGQTDVAVYKEGIYVGYRYFDSFAVGARYGFGFGLSYTSFAIEAKVQQLAEIKGEAGMTETGFAIEALVKNTGKVAGREVVQVYGSMPAGELDKERRRLVGFAKTERIAPGEAQTCMIQTDLAHFASYSEKDGAWVLEPGLYGIWVGNSLENSAPVAGFQIRQKVILCRVKNICQSAVGEDDLQNAVRRPSSSGEKEEAVLKELLQRKQAAIYKIDETKIHTIRAEYKENKDIYQPDALQFVKSLNTDELIRLSSGDPNRAQGGNLGAAGISVPGSAGETSDCVVDRGLASIALADGPAGLRLMKYYYVKDGKIVPVPFSFNLEGGIFYQPSGQPEGDQYYQYCTAFPVGILLAQTWDTDLLYQVGQAVGEEMEWFGVTLWLAPGMNIHRNPLCGRNFEYYSEDPFLSGKMAAAMTRGVQSHRGCGTTIKHFACNNQEDNRMGCDSIVSERALREIYLRGFEIAVRESRPMAVMTSYNLINGVHAANNRDLCTDVLRNEWGFDGLVMTDWGTTEQGEDCTAAGCIAAGNDLIMPGCEGDHASIRKALDEGRLTVDELQACIARLVDVIWRSNQYQEVMKE